MKRQRRFFDVNILADEGAERKIGQHGREVGDHFLIETGADLHRRHKDAQHANVGVGDLADGLDGFQHHVIALDGVLVHLDGDENILNGDQHVDVKKAFERRGAVEEYKIVCIGKLRQQAAQGGVPAEGHFLHGCQSRRQQTAATDEIEVFDTGVADGVSQSCAFGYDHVGQGVGGNFR